jgi:uncharacterized heparinase superfamily protein
VSELFTGLQIRLAAFGGAPTALAHQPQTVWMGDGARARAMTKGVYRLAGQELSAPGLGPWKLNSPGRAFADALHGFDWLGDFALLPGDEPKRVARSWIYGWIARFGDGDGDGWRPGLAGRRLTAWCIHAPLALQGADPELSKRFFRAVGVHARYLAGAWRKSDAGRSQISALGGLLYVSLTFDRYLAERDRNAQILGTAADRLVGPDGGIPSRNPEDLAEIHLALAAAAAELLRAGMEVPAPLRAALDRMAPALRLLRFGDGGLARFHGGHAGPGGRLDFALALAQAPRTAPARSAMGYWRMSAGRTAVVADAAPPPATPVAHASSLGFELSAGDQRVIVSSGPGAAFGAEWADACRATAAHSTLAVDRSSSSRIAARAKGPGPHLFSEVPAEVTAESAVDAAGEWLLMSHDGYRVSHGLVHQRRLFLSVDGRDFRGEDTVTAEADKDRRRHDAEAEGAVPGLGLRFSARFNVHPDLDVAVTPGGADISGAGALWRMTQRGGTVALESGVWFDPAARRPRATKQIVVMAATEGYGGRVTWAFRREDVPRSQRT